MLLPRDTPNPEQITALEQRYGCVDGGACETCILLLHTANDVVGAFCTHLAAHEMSQGRFIVLMLLNRDPEKVFMPSQLAEMCSVTKATMTGLIDGLEREGLVARHPSQEDRRAILVGMSQKGVELMDRILPGHFARVAALMQDLTVDERAEFRRLLAKVREGVGRVKGLNIDAGCAHEECAGG
ncbi:MAG TPA: MarR family transcriptional regulator [Opitutaceae bacterium]|nr:MarR family transcriptional regulator [Opitutaceae bacterium]